MEIRRTKKADIHEIRDVCEICYGTSMSEIYYYWLYSKNGNFYSYVMLDNNKIIGHQAIIERRYIYDEKEIIVGLSCGTMILPKYQKSGDFYFLLKESLNSFKGDIIIGFPNENSHGIFRKLFHFKVIPNNTFQLGINDKLSCIKTPIKDPFIRNDNKWRLEEHPYNKYKCQIKGECKIIWKKYIGNSIDIIYTNIINNDFVDMITEFQKQYSYINIISIFCEQLEQIGFHKVPGNEFVYLAYNKKYDEVIFSCQMIDSDIY